MGPKKRQRWELDPRKTSVLHIGSVLGTCLKKERRGKARGGTRTSRREIRETASMRAGGRVAKIEDRRSLVDHTGAAGRDRGGKNNDKKDEG